MTTHVSTKQLETRAKAHIEYLEQTKTINYVPMKSAMLKYEKQMLDCEEKSMGNYSMNNSKWKDIFMSYINILDIKKINNRFVCSKEILEKIDFELLEQVELIEDEEEEADDEPEHRYNNFTLGGAYKQHLKDVANIETKTWVPVKQFLDKLMNELDIKQVQTYGKDPYTYKYWSSTIDKYKGGMAVERRGSKYFVSKEQMDDLDLPLIHNHEMVRNMNSAHSGKSIDDPYMKYHNVLLKFA